MIYSTEWLDPWNVLLSTKTRGGLSHRTRTQVWRFMNDMVTCMLQSIDENSWLYPLWSSDTYATRLEAANTFKTDNLDLASELRTSADGRMAYLLERIG